VFDSASVAVIASSSPFFGGVWMRLHRSVGSTAISGDVVDLFGSGLVAW